MTAKEIADRADMIVAGFAYSLRDGYVEVIDLNDLGKRAVIQEDDIVESLMSDEEDDLVLKYYLLNKETLEENHEGKP